MSKLPEMMARLIAVGMNADNPPIGMMGGANLRTLKGIRMKCTKATFFARMEGEQIIDFERLLPYGFLHVEAPELRENTLVAIKHQLDFFNAWILNDRKLFDNPECEIHVTYKQASGLKTILRSIFPQFEYAVFNRGLFDDICNPEVREFALEEEPILRLYGHEQKIQSIEN